MSAYQPNSPPTGADGLVDETIDELQQMYEQLPKLECLGLCAHSCEDRIDASALERRRLLEAGIDLDASSSSGRCPALRQTFGAGRCSVHPIRPTICRLWGTTESMPCPHGCVPDGGLIDDQTAMRWVMTSLQIGGHHDGPVVNEQVHDLLELALTDPVIAKLLSRFLRGDRTGASALHERLSAMRP